MVINGTEIPVMSFTVNGATYGSTGSLDAMSSTKALDNIGFDLVAASIASPGSLPIDVYATIGDVDYHLFSGEYVTGDYDYDGATVAIHARDWAGPLVDQKRVLTSLIGGSGGAEAPDESSSSSGVSTQNQMLSKVVTAIAKQFSLTPVLNLASGSDSEVGAQFGNSTDTIMTATPQSLWGILSKLARQSGNVVYVTPEKNLVFGTPGAGLPTLNLVWGQTTLGDGVVPVKGLTFTHNPRRNLTFRVVVLSYNPTTAQTTKGEAYVIGSGQSTTGGATVKAGAWSGASAQQITNAIGSGSKSKKNAIPLYTFHADGLTAAQAQARATAIAADIAKRELVVKCNTDVIPGLSPSQSATIMGNINAEFASHTYYVTGYSHVFKLMRGGTSSQFDTTMSLLDQQPAGTGKAVSQPSEAA
jgi:hypothetical protein